MIAPPTIPLLACLIAAAVSAVEPAKPQARFRFEGDGAGSGAGAAAQFPHGAGFPRDLPREGEACLELDGDGRYCILRWDQPAEPPAGGRTVALWIRPARLEQDCTIYDEGDEHEGVAIRLVSDRLAIRRIGPGGVSEIAAPGPAVDRWTHLALVSAADGLVLYLDGRVAGRAQAGPAAPRALGEAGLGCRLGYADAFGRHGGQAFSDRRFAGRLDDVHIFSIAIDQAGVTRLQAVADLPAGGIPQLQVATSWLGNSYGGAERMHVQNDICAIAVTASGRVFTNSIFDEAHWNQGYYEQGRALGRLEGNCGWSPRTGGHAVAVNDTHVFVSVGVEPGKAGERCIVRRYRHDGSEEPWAASAPSPDFAGRWDAIKGLAADASHLFVSDGSGSLHVFALDQSAPARSFPAEGAGPLAIDHAGRIWHAPLGLAGQVRAYAIDGRLVARLPLDPLVRVSALAQRRSSRELLVADNGPGQRVLCFDVSGEPRLAWTLGEEGGVFRKPRGEVGDMRFCGLSGVGSDALGDVYVATRGFGGDASGTARSATTMQCFPASGPRKWILRSLEFVDNGSWDPADQTYYCTKYNGYRLDYSMAEPGRGWQWIGTSIDPFRYPQDPRLHLPGVEVHNPQGAAVLRRIGSALVMAVTDMNGHFLSVFRREQDGAIFAPCALFGRSHGSWWLRDRNYPPFQPAPGHGYIWNDADGDGAFAADEMASTPDHAWSMAWCMDEQGGIWRGEAGSLRRFPCLDRQGVLRWTYESSTSYPLPAPLDGHIGRIDYDAASDRLLASGDTASLRHPGDDWKHTGAVLARFDGFVKQQGRGAPAWCIELPTGEDAKIGAWAVAGDYVFCVGFKSRGLVWVYRLSDGGLVGQMRPGPEIGGQRDFGWVDLPYGIRAIRRPDGEYVISIEEDWRAKVVLYRWRP